MADLIGRMEFKTPRFARFSLTHGYIDFTWYAPLSPQDVQDIQDWLKIVERQILREGVKP